MRMQTDRTGAWHDGNLDWTGASGGLQFRVEARCARLRSYEVWSRVTAAPVAGALAGRHAGDRVARRLGRERGDRACAAVGRSGVRLAVVHHTAGTNSYTRAQAAAIVRGIEVYHVQGNGWNDIGYNFLVDRFGTVYEGRGGGVDRNVIGAHAEGFNTGTAGIALLGNYTSAVPPLAQQNALATLLAWRLDVAHVDPRSTVVYTSGGNAKFRAGQVVTLRGDLRSSRHGAERVPRRSRVRAAARSRTARRADRPAEAVLADGDRIARRPDPVPGAALAPHWRGR